MFNGEPFILNRFLSFYPNNIDICEEINKYTFLCSKEIILTLMQCRIPKKVKTPFVKYIKEIKQKEGEYDFILRLVKKHYGWSEAELGRYKKLLLKMFEDKEVLREYFRFFGVEKKYYKQFGLEFKKHATPIDNWF